MSTYTVDFICKNGAKYMFALLLQHIRGGEEPFVTYGEIARLLEVKLGIPRVFPTHGGPVAGALMDQIEKAAPEAPLINALVTRPSGIPGRGFGSYYNRRIRLKGEPRWEKLASQRKLAIVAKVRSEVRQYELWDQIYRKLFRTKLPKNRSRKQYRELDGKPAETSRPAGKGESQEHRLLKEWAVANPEALGLSRRFRGIPEKGLLSGDRIDVLFTDGKSFVAVEVKSIRSTNDDLQRGIYQCVKYSAVIRAQEHPVAVPTRSILLSERQLPQELKVRARSLGVLLRVRAVNVPEL